MKRLTAALIVAVMTTAALASAQPATDAQRALRSRLQQRFDLVSITDGIALRPKSAMGDVRLVEVSGGAILINGNPVTGQELRDRLGSDAEAVLQLSYLGADARRALLEPGEPVEAPRTGTPPPQSESPPPAPEPPDRTPRRQRASGDRVRILGDVTVREDETIQGDVVAVIGSVRVDGEVRGQVVAVLGSVHLGPNAIVNHDVVSVGGRVHRSEGARISGGVTEVSVAEPNVHFNFEPLVHWRGMFPFDGFGALPRLVGTAFRFTLLVLLTSIALVVARPTVEASAQRVSDRPVQSTLVGIAAQILIVPALVMTAVVLAISIIGIPLLLLIPFAVLVLVLMALAGFSGTVLSVGQWARRRLSLGSSPPIVDIMLGVTIVLLPVLLARLIAFAGWPGASLAIPLLMLGFAVELVAWSSGFGAVLTNAASRWQARRNGRTVVPPPMPS
jgi:hypothetical protein